MPLFHYTACDCDGKSVSGSVTEDSSAEALRKLEIRGLRDVKLTSGEATDDVADGVRAGDGTQGDSVSPRKGESGHGTEVISSAVQLMESGLPLAAGLQAFSEEVRSQSLRNSLQECARRLHQGEDLESILNTLPFRLPASLAGLVAAGTRVGNPVEFMTHYLRFATLQSRLREKIRLSLLYPAGLLIAGILILGALMYWVVPQMETIFDDFELDVPILTECLIITSQLTVMAVDWWPIVVVALIAGLLFLPTGLRYLNTKSTLRRLLYSLPLLGSTCRYRVLAEYFHLLAILIDHQVSMPEALKLAGDCSADCCLRKDAHELSRRVERGELLPGQMPGIIPIEILNVIHWGDRSGPGGDPPGDALRSAGDMYVAHTEIQFSVMTAMLGPVMVVLIGGVIGVLVVGLFEPLVSLVSQLS